MFYIHPLEQPLISAGIRLGEWIISNANLSDEERAKVSLVVDAVRRLPEISPDVLGSFGFRFADDSVEKWDGTGEVPIGRAEHWEVSYYPTSNSPDNLARGQIWFEIFNNRSTYPQCQHDDLYDIQFELGFMRTSVDTDEKDYNDFEPSAFSLARIYDWINCADHIETFMKREANFEIEVI
jgi:hypothetical protein